MKDTLLGRERALVGACGLYCGLCPRYQSSARSRCPGCRAGRMGAYCAVSRCVTNRGYLTCAECREYPACPRLSRSLKIDEGLDSFISHRPALANLDEIREHGLESFLVGQRERRLLAERLLASYNAGRSMTLHCTACALLPPRVIEQAVDRIERLIEEGDLSRDDRRGLARETRRIILELAERMEVDLALRHGRGKDQRSR